MNKPRKRERTTTTVEPNRTGVIWDGLHEHYGQEATVGGAEPSEGEAYWSGGAADADKIEALVGGFSKKAVLDYGCGVGRVALHVQPRCALLACADASQVALKRLGENARLRGMALPSHVTRVSRLDQLDARLTFDVIYAWHVAFHLTTVETLSLIHDAHARLRPGGVLAFDVCNAYHPRYVEVLQLAARAGTWHAGAYPHTPLCPDYLCYIAVHVIGFAYADVEARNAMQPAIICRKSWQFSPHVERADVL